MWLEHIHNSAVRHSSGADASPELQRPYIATFAKEEPHDQAGVASEHAKFESTAVPTAADGSLNKHNYGNILMFRSQNALGQIQKLATISMHIFYKESEPSKAMERTVRQQCLDTRLTECQPGYSHRCCQTDRWYLRSQQKFRCRAAWQCGCMYCMACIFGQFQPISTRTTT